MNVILSHKSSVNIDCHNFRMNGFYSLESNSATHSRRIKQPSIGIMLLPGVFSYTTGLLWALSFGSLFRPQTGWLCHNAIWEARFLCSYIPPWTLLLKHFQKTSNILHLSNTIGVVRGDNYFLLIIITFFEKIWMEGNDYHLPPAFVQRHSVTDIYIYVYIAQLLN